VTVLQGHPDPAGGHLCHALAAAYAEGAAAAGHELRTIDLARLGIPILRTQQEFEHDAVPEGLLAAQAAIVWAQHLLLVFPLWLGSPPALVKAFLEQVLRPGFAFAYRPRGFPERLLTGRSARLVVTMGMPALLYRWYFRAHGLKALERNVLAFVGIGPVRRDLLGNVGGADDATRRRWLERLREHGRRGH
jgi:putative NADPH-quinone reductase